MTVTPEVSSGEPVTTATPPEGMTSESVHAGTPPGGSPKLRRQATVYTSSRRWGKRALHGFLAVAVALVVLAAGIFFYGEYRYHQIKRLAVTGITYVAADQPMNILMVGNNSRCVLNGQQASAFGSCGDNGGDQVAGARSDVIMILHLNPATRSASLLSIPRDLVAPVPGHPGEMKIDSSLNYGTKALVQTIEADLGITINHFVMLNFDSFQGVVNALGGINMYFPEPVYDAESGLNAPHVLQTGCLHLDGFQALAEVRARHLWYYQDGYWHYDGGGDLSRIRRNHVFLKVLAAQVSKRGIGNPITDNSLISSLAPQLTVDSQLGIGDMLGLVERYHAIDANSLQDYTLPVVIGTADQYVVDGSAIGSVVFPSQPFDQNAIDAWLGLGGPPSASVSPAGIRVQVINTSGRYGLGSTVEQQLTAAGFNVSDGGDLPPIADPAETMVVYNGSSTLKPDEQQANLAKAERVAENFSGAVMLENSPTPPGVDVVVDATNFAVVNTLSSGGAASAGYAVAVEPPAVPKTSASPAHAPVSSVTGPTVAQSPTTTVSATTTTTSPIGAATDSRSGPEPWDPVACPAGSTGVPAQFNG